MHVELGRRGERGVQDDGADAVRIDTHGVERDAGAVGGAEQVPLRQPERLADLPQVDRRVTGVEGCEIDALRGEPIPAGGDALAERDFGIEGGIVERVLVELRDRKIGAVEARPGEARPPLIVEDDAPVAALLESVAHRHEHVGARLPRSAGEHHERVRLGTVREVLQQRQVNADAVRLLGKHALRIEISVRHRHPRHDADCGVSLRSGEAAVHPLEMGHEVPDRRVLGRKRPGLRSGGCQHAGRGRDKKLVQSAAHGSPPKLFHVVLPGKVANAP